MEKHARKFTESVWLDLVDRVVALYHCNEELTRSISDWSIGRLAAALPFLAGAKDAYRIALNNLLLVVAMSIPGVGKDVFLHGREDDQDVFHRLMLLYHEDGDHDIQMRGLALLAIVMINDYCTDMDSDAKVGKYNPVLTGAWDPVQKRKELVEQVQAIPCEEMDGIMSLENAVTQEYWLPPYVAN